MERRLLLAIALSVLVLVAWQFLLPAPPPPPAPEEAAGPAETEVPVEAGQPVGPPAVARPRAPAGPVVGRPAEVIAPLYGAAFGPGGGVTAWRLEYRGAKPLLVGRALPPLAVVVSGPEGASEVVALTPDRRRLEIAPEARPGVLRWRGTAADGLRVTKTLRFSADSYRIDVELRAERDGAPGEPLSLALYWTSPVAIPGATPEAPWVTIGEGPDKQQLLGRILVARAGPPEAFDAPSPALKDPEAPPGQAELQDPRPVGLAPVAGPRWVALENDYYIAALITPEDAQVIRGREPDLAQVGVLFPTVDLEPGRPWEGRLTAYVGPKEWARLAALGVGLEQAQGRNYGRFLGIPGIPMWWFCVPLLWLMNFFGTHVPGQNYGLAIILMTVVVKAVFYPLTQKSMTSMKKMQALQPQLNALRSKHKADPQRFQREQMELFRRHKVNPMGGCLPMVIQIPIFYALYLTLQYSVELQGAPFVLWITDLSKKDPYYVLPILMGASMFVQQKMTPTVGDPRQAKIMLLMPVFFTFMFLEFPTGLVLYWLVNNLLSIAQQYLIDRSARRAKVAVAAEAKPEKATKRA